MDSAAEFTLFPNLPIEIHLKVWEYAFPPRVVNIIYDKYEDRYHSFNTCVPTILHIHRESRIMALKTLKLFFGTESHEARIYFDASKDILLLDDYLELPSTNIAFPTILTSGYDIFPPVNELTTERRTIERLAINSSNLDLIRNITRTTTATADLSVWFPALQDLFIVIECVDPFHKSRIRIFDINEKHACSSVCSVCYVMHQILPGLDIFRKMYPKINVHLVGGFRGASRFDLGCYDKVVERDPGDDPIDVDAPGSPHAVSERDDSNIFATFPPFNESDEFSYDSDDGEVEKSHHEYLKGDIFKQYEYADVEETFSDFDGEDGYDPSIISQTELQDIRDDEKAYREARNVAHGDGFGSYRAFQDSWVDPEYYERRMEF